jgi:hypothetical protein
MEILNNFRSNFISILFFTLAPNDRSYGHGQIAGVFPVVKRQSECGRKTAGMHVSQPMDIGLC